MNTRTERDSLGELAVPADAAYGAQTQRAVNNFPVSGRPLPAAFVRALLRVKIAAARVNGALGERPADVADAIAAAGLALLDEADEALLAHFPVDVFQTGSGTSSNMNANEVLATLASRRLGRAVHPNDDVNRGQSSNDVIPTALHVAAAVGLADALLPALAHLAATTRDKAAAVGHHVKTGRTHLMDALPVTLGQSLDAWAVQVEQGAARLDAQRAELHRLAIGGTAVGTGLNAHADFAAGVAADLAAQTGLRFEAAPNPFVRIGAQDTAAALSGQLKALAVALMKIANDLRWMNSGPLAGLAEIELEALQPGSSIMPGKVNPVIPEAAAMVAAAVIGNDATVTVAAQSGNFELNVMLPLIADRLCDSIATLASASRLLADRAIATFRVNEDNLAAALARNPMLVTALNPKIGYERAAEIAKQAYRERRPIVDVAAERTGLPEDELRRLLDPARLTGQR